VRKVDPGSVSVAHDNSLAREVITLAAETSVARPGTEFAVQRRIRDQIGLVPEIVR
jgi:hypothetical protein